MRQPAASVFLIVSLALAGCTSDSYSGGSSSVTVGASFYYGAGWYGGTYYPYGPPGYVVVPPDYYPDRPGDPGRPGGPGEGPRPENPIATPLPAQPGASQLPSQRPEPSASASSRMPAAQPRVSSSSSRASIPRAPRGGGGRRR
jgi:hypothetical protein